MLLSVADADGLGCITPEIEQFVSRENRSHADPWLQQLEWVQRERTLTLHVREPPPGNVNVADADDLASTLSSARVLRMYFPASLNAKPFCFAEDDVLVSAAEAANARLLPLASNSVLAVVTTVLTCVKQNVPSTPYPMSGDGRLAASTRASIAAKAVLATIKEDPFGADLVLAFLSMAASSYRRDTVSTPFPKQLESPNRKRAYAVLVTCLEDVPPMSQMSRWKDPEELLRIPRVAFLALHFVLVFLPTKLRVVPRINAARSAAGISDSPGSGARRTKERAFTSRVDLPGGKGLSTPCRMEPCFEFEVVLPGDPIFDAQARRSGWSVAYHGSSPENFHSILNSGLRVMSGSRLMKNGAVFGDGIYLSASLEAAALFSMRGDGTGTTVWPRSAFGQPRWAFYGGSSTRADSSTRPKVFRYKLVAKCHVLTGDGVKEVDYRWRCLNHFWVSMDDVLSNVCKTIWTTQVERWGDEESYFVVSDASKVRIESLVLFDVGIPLENHLAMRRDMLSTNHGKPSNLTHVVRSSISGTKDKNGSKYKDEAQNTTTHVSGRKEDCLRRSSILWTFVMSSMMLLAAVPVVLSLMWVFFAEDRL